MSIFAMFRRSSQQPAHDGPLPAEMRGRADEITDPAAMRCEAVWEALKTEPPSDHPSTLTSELGLDEEQEIRGSYNADFPGTEFSGTRRWRPVAIGWGSFQASLGTGV